MDSSWRMRGSLTIIFFACLCMVSIAKEEAATLGTVIGIDLGTTHSSVGLDYDGGIQIIAKDQWHRLTPSWEAFTDGKTLIGEAAENQAAVNAERAFFYVKRLIGRKFEEKEVQGDIPYKIVNKDGKPYVEVKTEGGETRLFSPEEITAMILKKMKKTAEAFLGKEINYAVVTVPIYFSDAQRQATKDAGVIAGLNVLRIINEPMAAAMAYGYREYWYYCWSYCWHRGQMKDKENTILVFDLGGGTLDVSIFRIVNGVFEVLATTSDTHLGGEDFNQRIMEYFIKLIKKKHGKDISKDNRALGKLRREAERAKRVLSGKHQVLVKIESLVDGMDFSEVLTRARFEELSEDLFRNMMGPVKKAMEDAGIIEKRWIDEILLAGGSSRIPKVQQLLKDYFDGKEPGNWFRADPANMVALGAALHGSILSGEGATGDNLSRSDTFLGIETVGGVFSGLIPRKNPFWPTKGSTVFSTHRDQQDTISFEVFEGESSFTEDCRSLGKFNLSGIPPAPRGSPQIEVTFEVDGNSILYVRAEDKGTGKAENITIPLAQDNEYLSQDEMFRMIREAMAAAEDTSSREAEGPLADVGDKVKEKPRHGLNTYAKKQAARLAAMKGKKPARKWLEKEPRGFLRDRA